MAEPTSPVYNACAALCAAMGQAVKLVRCAVEGTRPSYEDLSYWFYQIDLVEQELGVLAETLTDLNLEPEAWEHAETRLWRLLRTGSPDAAPEEPESPADAT